MAAGKKIGSRTRSALVTLLFMVAGAAVGWTLARNGFRPLPDFEFTVMQVGVLVLSLPVLYLVCIAGHELGHVLAGRLVGFRTLLFVVGPFRLERSEHGFRPAFNRDVMTAGGLAAMVPVGLEDLRRRTIVMVAGGPLASLMIGTQFLALYHATSGVLLRGGFASIHAAVALLAIGCASLLIGLLTLIPGRAGGFYSDGARLLRLMRVTQETEREVALLALSGLTIAGTRPSEWDSELVALGAGIRDGGPFEVGGRQFAYAHALDRGDIDAARQHLNAALERSKQLPAASRSSLLLAAATFAALYDADAARARGCLEAAAREDLLVAPHQRLLAEAAVLLAEGEFTAARAAALQAQALAGRAIDRGGAALDEALAGRILSAGT
jgi:hypothetical protein